MFLMVTVILSRMYTIKMIFPVQGRRNVREGPPGKINGRAGKIRGRFYYLRAVSKENDK